MEVVMLSESGTMSDSAYEYALGKVKNEGPKKSELKKLRIRKPLGTWYYEKVESWTDYGPDGTYDYILYDENKKYVSSFDYYSDMHDWIVKEFFYNYHKGVYSRLI